MSEKIYGITENILRCQLAKYEVDNILEDSVPVVSIKWLEKYCYSNGMVCMSCGAVTCAICQKDLLSAAKKEAGK